MNTRAKETQSIRFRGRSFMAFVLEPVKPIDAWLIELDDWVRRSPGFFSNRPVILGVAGIVDNRRELVALVSALERQGVRIMAIEGANPEWMGSGLPPAVTGGRPASMIEVVPPVVAPAPVVAAPEPVPEPKPAPGLLIDHPVRSGQTIVSDGDVTVIGSVASGAEIVAGGSIHIYGALRGRAVAGTAGNAKARIFARKFEAEFVAIDGVYLTAEELDPKIRGRSVQARLVNNLIETAVLA